MKPEDQDLCKRLFLRLVQPGEGADDTKRRVSFRELLPADPARADAVRRLVDVLAARDARLITTEADDATGGSIEVAHEALIRSWTQLREWVEADRANLRTQRRLTEAAHEWAAAGSGQKEDYLYSGTRLAVVREWIETHPDELSSLEAAFLSASEESERRRELAEQEVERHLEDVNRLAVKGQKTYVRRWVTTVIIAGGFALTNLILMFPLIWFYQHGRFYRGELYRLENQLHYEPARMAGRRSRPDAGLHMAWAGCP